MNREQFQRLIHQKGIELYRDMPWRLDTRPYYVLVSELMLQQTQVGRVIPKFEQFIAVFPDEFALARASLAEVLVVWQGLGYNRRAQFLWRAVRMIVDEFCGRFPNSDADLLRLPGVGKNTAGAIAAYAYNRPSVFIETNVRTVYLHHLFADADAVTDADIMQELLATLDRTHPRKFYWALMDYGTYLKSQGIKAHVRSRHYRIQSPLEGSVRQVRGQIIKVLAKHGALRDEQLRNLVAADERYPAALAGLERDNIVSVQAGRVAIVEAPFIDKT